MDIVHAISDDPIWNLCLNLLSDDSVSEIEANGPNAFFYKRNGKRLQLDISINESDDKKAIEAYHNSIKAGLVKHVHSPWPYKENSYIFEGPLRYTADKGGPAEREIRGRCHIVLPPAADAAQVTIAKKSTALPGLTDIASRGSMSTEMLYFLIKAIEADLTIVVSGGTGAGKALHRDTLIPTPTGFVPMSKLAVGDTVFDDRGFKTTVLKKYCPKDPVSYELNIGNMEKVRSSAGHLWKVRMLNKEETLSKLPQPFLSLDEHEELRILIKGIDEVDTISPDALKSDFGLSNNFLQGIFEGSGVLNKKEVMNRILTESQKRLDFQELRHENEIPSVIMTTQEMFDAGVLSPDNNSNFSIEKLAGPVEYSENTLPFAPADFGASLKNIDGITIPEIYKLSSAAQRNELLTGLIAALGNDLGDKVEFRIISEALAKDIREIALSLGRISSGIEFDGEYVFWVSSNTDEDEYEITGIKEVSDRAEDYFCIMVDSPSSLFLCSESFIPTHNTTILEAMTKMMRSDIRIGVAEDAPELYLTQPNVTYLHSVPWAPGMNPNDVATLSWVVAQFQRMRTDKVIIGETRGPEFADFLIAANSGMDGSLTTIHANDPKTCLDKMMGFALRATNAPVRSINTDIANSIDLIVQLKILPDGRHRMDRIEEITTTLGTDESAKITTNNLYRYNEENDTFTKGNPLSDGMRRQFTVKGINIDPLLLSSVGKESNPHSGQADMERFLNEVRGPGNSGGGSAGLPTPDVGPPRRM